MDGTDSVIHVFYYQGKHLIRALVRDGQPPLFFMQDILGAGQSPDELKRSLDFGEVGFGSTKSVNGRFVFQSEAEMLRYFGDHPEDVLDVVTACLARMP